jgi:hypothetical protein
MSQRSCPRCHTLLVNEDPGALLYCSHCGAPQVLLSEELREQAAERAETLTPAPEASAGNFAEAGLTSLDTSDPTAVDWTEAVRIAGLGGLIALGLGLISMAVPPVALLDLLWALIAPIVVLGIYCSRRKHTLIRAGFGARLGLLTGLTIAWAISTIAALQFIIGRFVLHRGTEIDAALAGMFTKVQETQAANQQPMPFNLAIPEFRVGLLLSSISFAICLYLAYALISGAFGGLLRSRSRAA